MSNKPVLSEEIEYESSDQTRTQDFTWGGGGGAGGVLMRPKWTKLPNCIFDCLIRVLRKVAIHENL